VKVYSTPSHYSSLTVQKNLSHLTGFEVSPKELAAIMTVVPVCFDLCGVITAAFGFEFAHGCTPQRKTSC